MSASNSNTKAIWAGHLNNSLIIESESAYKLSIHVHYRHNYSFLILTKNGTDMRTGQYL